MKKIFTLAGCLIFSLLVSLQAQESSTKIKIKVKDADGRLIEKEYESEEAFRKDPDLKNLGVEIDAEEGMIRMESKGSGNRIVIMQSNSKGEQGGFSYSFDKDTEILMDDSLLYIFQGRFHSDSLEQPRWLALKKMRSHRGEMDSLRREHREEMFLRRDSLREVHRQYREEHREEMEKHREEFRARTEQMRERMREMDVEMEEGTRIIIIQELSKEETDQLKESKKKDLELNQLRFYPNPSTGELQLALEAREAGPVEIKLIAANSNEVLYEARRKLKAGEVFKETIKLENYQPGWYRLQLRQNNKILNRKVIIK